MQVTYDTEYLFGILLSACRNHTNRLIAKYEYNNCYNGLLLWQDIVTEYAHHGSLENTIFRISDKLRVPPVDDAKPQNLLTYLDTYKTDLYTLKTLEKEEFWEMTWKWRFLRMFDYVSNYEFASGVQTCRDDSTRDVFDSIVYLRSVVLFWQEGESHS